MKLDFKHTQAAHCENGVTTSLLRHHGVNQIYRTSGVWYRLRTFLYIYPVHENQ